MDEKYFEEMEARIPKGVVRTRFAPSPTGYMHVGNLRTALYTWCIARHYGGKFLLRIEDTDQNRLVEDATAVIYKTLTDCGLDWDEGPDKGAPSDPISRPSAGRRICHTRSVSWSGDMPTTASARRPRAARTAACSSGRRTPAVT